MSDERIPPGDTAETKDQPKNHFTIGIHDDVSHSSLEWDPAFRTDARRAKSNKLHIAALEQQLAALEVSEYITECEEQLRQEIQRIRGEIERHRRILEHNLDGIESIQDPQELDDGMAAKL